MSNEPVPAWAQELTPRTPAARAKNSQSDSFYEEMASLRPLSHVYGNGRALRAEAERFVAWVNYMGEGSASTRWGQSQQNFAADWRARYRAYAAKLKIDIEAEGENLACVLDYIWGEKGRGQYPEEITMQARQELGL